MAEAETPVAPEKPEPVRVYRHRLPVRIWHWINALTLLILLMSGLMIFNAHPRLYWGEYGANFDRAWLVIGSTADTGYLRVGNWRIDTTGVLGRWTDAQGATKTWAFPGWATIPTSYSLADGRRWHLLFAWLLSVGLALYMLWTLLGGHLRKDLHVRRAEWSPRHIWHDAKDHARLRFPKGEAAARYGILQKLSYIGVIFVALPLMIATGLTMSPGMNAAWPWLLDLFGGRQSARSIHFITAWALVAFFLVHIAMVLLAGPANEIRSMVTGWFRLPQERET
ncbi:Ni/Fe-hydrogenase b-type cytochrome subunit [Sphingopyxis italica]|uniref:Ni/Fe-hydrogenase b-type cytochrome subunit n=1 Tax=Sphingopyxis italica TaxID=1129133 RepID=A0A7X5XSA3_9SPHN|nr:cytochrome b/b6 domain-containing protein [Sphingopyxis italica]NJB90383.1 Ni/Fe-hydrogenase b-type cytochrome subunit [Sphingopyxis italica]